MLSAVVVAGVDGRDCPALIVYCLRIVVRLVFLIISIVCLSEKDRTRRKPEC